MQHHAQNRAEWDGPANWSSWVYFSKNDPRLRVPKRIPALGWTINLGHPRGPAIMLGIFGGIMLLVIGIYIGALMLAA